MCIRDRGKMGEGRYIILFHGEAERMPSTNSDAPFVAITIITHGDECGLQYLACFYGRDVSSVSSECGKLSCHGEYPRGISWIKSSVVEGSSVYFDSANSTRTVL